jgi:hypothetical protein
MRAELVKSLCVDVLALKDFPEKRLAWDILQPSGTCLDQQDLK